MAKLKDLSKAQVLYDALMIVTDGEKYAIREICDILSDNDIHKREDIKVYEQVIDVCGRINFHLIQQGY